MRCKKPSEYPREARLVFTREGAPIGGELTMMFLKFMSKLIESI